MEIWKEIEGYPGYEVSNLGNVKGKRLKRNMKQQVTKKGQVTVLLSDNGKDKRVLVSRLVANAFISNPNNYPVVMHIDDDPQNNLVNNLMWGTQKMNLDDMIEKGRSKRIISDEVVKFIKENYYKVVNQYDVVPQGKYTSKELANMFNVTKSAIIPILNGKRYNNIK